MRSNNGQFCWVSITSVLFCYYISMMASFAWLQDFNDICFILL